MIIRENQVPVPVEVGYEGRKADLALLLDTGVCTFCEAPAEENPRGRNA